MAKNIDISEVRKEVAKIYDRLLPTKTSRGEFNKAMRNAMLDLGVQYGYEVNSDYRIKYKDTQYIEKNGKSDVVWYDSNHEPVLVLEVDDSCRKRSMLKLLNSGIDTLWVYYGNKVDTAKSIIREIDPAGTVDVVWL